MLEPVTLGLALFVIGLALLFDFTNGFHDAANQVATVISSRAMEPRLALAVAAVGDFVGAYFLGTNVAKAIGKDIVDPRLLEVSPEKGVWVVVAALVGAIAFNLATWRLGLPSSSSHALIGGLLGAFAVGWGVDQVNWPSVGRIVGIMVLSPIAGFLVALMVTRLTLFICQGATPRANRMFKGLQVISAATQALSHGTNDAQKTMGVITFVLVLLNLYVPPAGAFVIPDWVIAVCSIVIALGTLSGGWRIIRTLGAGLYRVRPIHGFASQATSTSIIYLTAVFGFPVSTTQVISASVMGAGAAFRPKMVRWEVARDMVGAWLVTIPAAGAIAAGSYMMMRLAL